MLCLLTRYGPLLNCTTLSQCCIIFYRTFQCPGKLLYIPGHYQNIIRLSYEARRLVVVDTVVQGNGL